MLLNSGETQQEQLVRAPVSSFSLCPASCAPVPSPLGGPSRHCTGVIVMLHSDTGKTLGLVIQIISREDSNTARAFSCLGTGQLDVYGQQKCGTGRSDHILFNMSNSTLICSGKFQ